MPCFFNTIDIIDDVDIRWPCQCGLIALFMRRGLLNKFNLLPVRFCCSDWIHVPGLAAYFANVDVTMWVALEEPFGLNNAQPYKSMPERRASLLAVARLAELCSNWCMTMSPSMPPPTTC